jgi:DNA polymerase-4
MLLPRHILSVDPPAFCTTVEVLRNSNFRERPLAVAAPGADRATILALSAEARAAGITRGMPVQKAQKVCPDLIVRPPNPELYARASRALHEILKRYAPIIEPRGYGHAYLDISGTERLFGKPIDVAHKLWKESGERLKLPLAVGVATNKLVSQAASTVLKEIDGGQAVRRSGGQALGVDVGTEARFLAPESVTLLPDLDDRMRLRLDDYQLDLIGDVQAISDDDLAAVFGAPGRTLGSYARGIDARPVLPPAVKAEFRAVHTLGNDSNSRELLHRILRHLTERLGARLRARQLVARRLTLHLAYTDYHTARRSLPIPISALDAELYQVARKALLLEPRTVALRAVGIVVDRFLEANTQLEFDWEGGNSLSRAQRGSEPGTGNGRRPPERSEGRQQAMQGAIDRIQSRWGKRGLRVVR